MRYVYDLCMICDMHELELASCACARAACMLYVRTYVYVYVRTYVRYVPCMHVRAPGRPCAYACMRMQLAHVQAAPAGTYQRAPSAAEPAGSGYPAAVDIIIYNIIYIYHGCFYVDI